MEKMRVLYVLYEFPEISQTYMKSELEALQHDYDIRVITRNAAHNPYRGHFPFTETNDLEAIREAAHEFKPHVLHGHYLHTAFYLSNLAKSLQVPFTLRAHSFDVIKPPRPLVTRVKVAVRTRSPKRVVAGGHIKAMAPLINDEHCLGLLTFPFTRGLLEKNGIAPDKIVDCFPVVNFDLFYDRSSNGEHIMNTGAAIPKKRMEDFVTLAKELPHLEFNLYAMGYDVGRLQTVNEAAGRPVNFQPLIEPNQMPAEYKKHQWLVYTASFDMKTVGWPMAIAEAQASGVGVCMANIRPDLKQYVGDAGILFDSLHDIMDVIQKPVPEEMREAGFEQARKSNINEHKRLLTDLWDQVRVRQPASNA